MSQENKSKGVYRDNSYVDHISVIGQLREELGEIKEKNNYLYKENDRLYKEKKKVEAKVRWESLWLSANRSVVLIMITLIGSYCFILWATASDRPTYCTVETYSEQTGCNRVLDIPESDNAFCKNGHPAWRRGFELIGVRPWRYDQKFGRYPTISLAVKAGKELNCSMDHSTRNP